MTQRWFIRSIFLFLLGLCLGGWGWSYSKKMPILGCGNFPGDRLWMVLPHEGALKASWGSYCPNYPEGVFLTWGLGFDFSNVRWHFLGFGVLTDENYFNWVGIPFWFLTALAVFLLLFMWRMTRKRGPGGAFPVVMKVRGTA